MVTFTSALSIRDVSARARDKRRPPPRRAYSTAPAAEKSGANAALLACKRHTAQPDGWYGRNCLFNRNFRNSPPPFKLFARGAGEESRTCQAATVGFVIDRGEQPRVECQIGSHGPAGIKDERYEDSGFARTDLA